jgi:type IV secretory pathway component VirB8
VKINNIILNAAMTYNTLKRTKVSWQNFASIFNIGNEKLPAKAGGKEVLVSILLGKLINPED